MSATFPQQIESLPAFAGPFDAFRLEAADCDVLFASYPAGTTIGDHDHDTDNVGIITAGELILIINREEHCYGPGAWYHVSPGQKHAARFKTDTSEIEFWFSPRVAEPS